MCREGALVLPTCLAAQPAAACRAGACTACLVTPTQPCPLTAPSAALPPPQPQLAPTPLAQPPSVPLPQEAAGQAGGGFAPLPFGLLDDLPFVPLPEEIRGNASGSAYSAHTGTPWHLASSSSIDNMDLDLPAWQCSEPLGAPPPLPRALTPLSLVPQAVPASVSPSVLATAQSMLVPPSHVAAGTAVPLVGYGQRAVGSEGAAAAPAAMASSTLLARFSLKVFQCRPEQLAPAVRQELNNMLQVGWAGRCRAPLARCCSVSCVVGMEAASRGTWAGLWIRRCEISGSCSARRGPSAASTFSLT